MLLEVPIRILCCIVVLLASPLSLVSQIAATPPMGWNSWDSFGLSVTEGEFKQNAQWMAANLKRLGWQYVVVDEGWYLKNPEAKAGTFQFVLSKDGRYFPATNRFPSAAHDAGFKPLADYVHSLGLKFGIHIIRGIPKLAVERDVTFAHSSFQASDAVDKSDTCPWNADNYGVRATPAGQAYYDSVAQLYADWGVDLVKVDCIASHPYKGDEIGMISQALQKTARPIALSLSPGPAPLDHAADFRKFGQMWRISDDVWDHWSHDKKIDFSQGVVEQFPVAASWATFTGGGHWPDADMLPIGFLGPRPGLGAARESNLTHDEQRSLMTAWCLFRSPLFMGGNLTKMDEWTKSLLTNSEVLAVDQHSVGAQAAVTDAKKAVWVSKQGNGRGAWVALFNLSNARQTIEYPLQSLGLSGAAFHIRDLWGQKDLAQADRLKVALAPHASMLYEVK